MWACLFWGLQTALALGIIKGRAEWGAASSSVTRATFAGAKAFVGCGLLTAFSQGVVKWVIATAGVMELVTALLLLTLSPDGAPAAVKKQQ